MAECGPSCRSCLYPLSQRISVLALHPNVITPGPEATARVARAAFPNGPPSLTVRAVRRILLQDEDLAALFPASGQAGLPPWRLARGTLRQLRENVADRQGAAAVRARIAWKSLLSREWTAPGFAFSVLSECRDRLRAGSAATLLVAKRLERCRIMGLRKGRGQPRTDSTPGLAAIRVMQRRDLVAATLRATLNALAPVAPPWLHAMAPLVWYERSGK